MGEIIIRAEKISKRYRLGTLGAGRFREDWKNWWGKRRGGKEGAERDAKEGVERERKDGVEGGKKDGVEGGGQEGAGRGEIWALKDVSFEIARGEVVGFIGKNGAGKSTLLKIISRITRPSSGIIRGKGRVASLLEVGTGFHGELTGRENVFLNGHILGMKREEILSQFDRIVDFSGVEAFLDTPVKRYSSGMYVRLAFAVAAHLNPEILIVDEVLAVGDAEFQQKCIGKMKEVSSREGRTVLFVSHNMQALRNLCSRALTLDRGKLVDGGDPAGVIANYLRREKVQYLQQRYADPVSAPGNAAIRIKRVELVPDHLPGQELIDIRTPLLLDLEFWYDPADAGDLIVGVHLFSIAGDCVFDVSSERYMLGKGLVGCQCRIPGQFLNDGSYYISIVFVSNTTKRLFYFESCITFDVEDFRENTAWYGKWIGHVRPAFPVVLQPVKEPPYAGI